MVFVLVALVAAAALVAFYRLLAGPRPADRVVALDLLFAVAIVLGLCAAIATGRTAFVDVAIVLALVGFVGTLAWARLVEQLERGEEGGSS